jgi:hypothetical protein
MIKLYYTGASTPDIPQTDSQKSLGGHISSTVVPNGKLNELFSEVSMAYSSLGKEEYICLAVKNDSQQSLLDLKITSILSNNVGYPDFASEYEIGFSIPNSKGEIEKIPNKESAPYYTEFFKSVSKRARGTLKVLSPGSEGDEITVLGEIITLSGDTIESLVFDIIDQFGSPDYYFEVKSDSEIYFEALDVNQNNIPLGITTDGSADSTQTFLTGAVANYSEIIEDLQPGKFIAFWIKRKPKKPVILSCEKLQNVELRKSDSIDFLFYWEEPEEPSE